LAGFQGFVAVHFDGGVMGKQVFGLAFLIDEAVTLGIVEPLDLADLPCPYPSATDSITGVSSSSSASRK
jgi:hypothetical protein